jgi:hypothetical protein
VQSVHAGLLAVLHCMLFGFPAGVTRRIRWRLYMADGRAYILGLIYSQVATVLYRNFERLELLNNYKLMAKR